MIEVWKDIIGYEGIYQVSNLGRVRSILADEHYRARILKPNKQLGGYLFVNLWKDKKGKPKTIHRLVAMAFIPNPDNLPYINHRDEDKTNNVVVLDNNGNIIETNLEWCTQKYNANYGTSVKRLIETRNLRGVHSAEKIVYQCDLNGNVIKEWRSLMEINRNGYSRRCVQDFFKGRLKTYRGCLWIPKSEYNQYIEHHNLILDPNYKENNE